jgi:hypothetical protein
LAAGAGKKSLSFADIVKLPLTGANAIPIRNNIKSPGGFERQLQTRTSVFGRLGPSPGNMASVCNDWRFPTGGRYQSRTRISAFNRLGLLSSSSRPSAVPHRFSSSDPIGEVHGGGMHVRSNFQNSNFNRYRRRNLHWCPVRPQGPVGLMGPSAFCCFFVRRSVTWSFFVPQRNLLSVSRWPHFLPLGAVPFWWEIEILRITLLGFALPWCPCPMDRPVSVASRSSPESY